MQSKGRLQSIARFAVTAAALVAVSGCATKGYVREQVAEGRNYTDSRFTEVGGRVDQMSARLDQTSALAEQIAAGNYNEVSTHQVQFEFDDYRLSPEMQSMLDQVAAQLGSHPRYVLEIRGYADAIGTERYNYKLGRERSDEVTRYLLTRHSVPPMRMVGVSFGEESPLADNGSSEGRSQNRRVQVRVLELGSAPAPRANVLPAP